MKKSYLPDVVGRRILKIALAIFSIVAAIPVLVLILLIINSVRNEFLIPSDDQLIKKSVALANFVERVHRIANYLPHANWSIDKNGVEFVHPHRNRLTTETYFNEWLQDNLVLELNEHGLRHVTFYAEKKCAAFKFPWDGIFISEVKSLYHCMGKKSPDCGPIIRTALEPYYREWLPHEGRKKSYPYRIQRFIGQGWYICLENLA